MTDFDKMTTAIEKLQPNSEWRLKIQWWNS